MELNQRFESKDDLRCAIEQWMNGSGAAVTIKGEAMTPDGMYYITGPDDRVEWDTSVLVVNGRIVAVK